MSYGFHFVRVGRLGQVGRFQAADGTRYPRRARVVCRTGRGLEIGEVLSPGTNPSGQTDGQLLRAVTVEDDLLLARIERRRHQAFQACAELVAERDLPVVLMDVEHLFDGRSLYFYFLGEVSGEVERLTEQLARLYEAEVQFRKFSETLSQGCGPECGTENSSGCGSDSCSSCALSGACGPRGKA